MNDSNGTVYIPSKEDISFIPNNYGNNSNETVYISFKEDTGFIPNN